MQEAEEEYREAINIDPSPCRELAQFHLASLLLGYASNCVLIYHIVLLVLVVRFWQADTRAMVRSEAVRKKAARENWSTRDLWHQSS